MERNIQIRLEEARKWFNSENTTLQEIALRCFTKEELKCEFKDIKTFKDACTALNFNYDIATVLAKDIFVYSRAAAAMFKLNIIRKALNLNYDLSLVEDPKEFFIHYPYNLFITEDSAAFKKEIKEGPMEVIGKIKNKGILYTVIGGYSCSSDDGGLGEFYYLSGVGYATASTGFLGCATKEIARHFGKYFGMLITEAKYADMVDFEIIDDKYGNTK